MNKVLHVNPDGLTFDDRLSLVLGAPQAPSIAHAAYNDGYYTPVGWIDGDLADCIRLTQRTFPPGWWLHQKVVPIAGFDQRATATGDLIETEQGKFYLILPFGFELLEGECF